MTYQRGPAAPNFFGGGEHPDVAGVRLSQERAEVVRALLGIGALQMLDKLLDRAIQPPQEVRSGSGLAEVRGGGRQHQKLKIPRGLQIVAP